MTESDGVTAFLLHSANCAPPNAHRPIDVGDASACCLVLSPWSLRSRLCSCPGGKIFWPHAPVHALAVGGTFFVTGSTYQKLHHFRGAQRLGVLHRGLLKLALEFGWQLEAWAILSNHYHFVAHSPCNQNTAESLSTLLREFTRRQRFGSIA